MLFIFAYYILFKKSPIIPVWCTHYSSLKTSMYLLVVVLIALPEVASFPASLSLASIFQLCSIKNKLARDRGYT